MDVKHGIPAAPGLAIREAYVLDTEEVHIPQRFIEKDEVESELRRYEEGARVALQSLDQEMEKMGEEIQINVDILNIHKILIQDPKLQSEIREGIEEKQYTAEHSVARTINRYIKKFEALDSAIFSERVHDFYDIEKLLIKSLLGHRLETLHTLDREVVVVAHNLTPAEAAKLDPQYVRGFVADVGGQTSHTAIMARALGIPAVLGLEDVSTTALAGDTIIVDGFRGVVIVSPDTATLEEYRERESDVRKLARRMRRESLLPSETEDGYRVDVLANIELSQEVATAVELGASGVGLYRTEFVHLQKPRGGEDWHHQHYRKVVEGLEGRPITIRTLDLGGDKGMAAEGLEDEENPFLGCRSLRYCFAHPELFRDQLRAIFRASVGAEVRIMLPMVTAVPEIARARKVIDGVREELIAEGVEVGGPLSLGIMIEVPAVAIIADQIAPLVDFFSVGTNDLVQYTLAVDRGNEHVADLYDPVHPAVLRLLERLLDVGKDAGIEVSICGEMASEPLYIPLLIGLGFRSLSVSPPMLPEVKQIVRSIRVHDVRALVAHCRTLATGSEITDELRVWVRENLPNIVARG